MPPPPLSLNGFVGQGLEAQVAQKVMKNGKRCIVKRANISADSAGKEFTTELIEINQSIMMSYLT